jgi:ABC-type lipoprotein export system ATPase subunit
VNTTLGRDLLDTAKKNNFAFITNTAGKIGIVTDEFYFIKNLNFKDEQLVPVVYNGKSYTLAQRDSIRDVYQTSLQHFLKPPATC